MRAIFRKELADYFNSIRFLILFLLAVLVSVMTLYADYQGIRGTDQPTKFIFLALFTTAGTGFLSLFTFINIFALFFVPIIGISLGFDAINKERSGGTLSRIIAQPVFRDGIINGKFLSGVFVLFIMVLSTMLIVSGYGLYMIGVPPNPEEIIRLFLYFIFTILYGAFWMGIAILFSTLFRNLATSLLSSVALWLFLLFYILMIVPGIASAVAPVTQNSTQEAIIHNAELQQTLLRFSPNYLFLETASVLLQPPLIGSLGIITSEQVTFMIANPLSLGQSILLVWPHLTSLISLSVICFAISYILFMKQEIRAT